MVLTLAISVINPQKNVAEGEIAKIQQFLFSLAFILCHPYTTLPSLHLY
jgi:hypothetical protein